MADGDGDVDGTWDPVEARQVNYDVSHLTNEQQRQLEPQLNRLGYLCKCCTFGFSLVPYYLYAKYVLRRIKSVDNENLRPATRSPKAAGQSGDHIV